ncbi:MULTISPECIES: TetR family transcriptional regulator [Pseudomonas]|uniref:TetR family transcriptional regulator n=2 Tax=Pseudomonas TaxID=286 RepID=A0AAU8LD43_PSESX|nr:TetR family transcriptional regulator [Pseudomonas triticifolii]MBC3954897.1 TetR family transcriptional regulator [Pseudomonas triticifolii]
MKITEELGRRERKKLMLREALIEAAYNLFEQKGFDDTRVEDITDTVDVSSRTFFRYFASKEDIVLDYQEVEHDEVISALNLRPQGERILTTLRRAVVEVVHGCEMGSYGLDSNRFQVLKHLIRGHPLVCARNLERTQDRKRALIEVLATKMRVDPRFDNRPSLVANTLEYAYTAAYEIWKDIPDGSRMYSAVLDEVFEAIESGLNYPCPE